MSNKTIFNTNKSIFALKIESQQILDPLFPIAGAENFDLCGIGATDAVIVKGEIAPQASTQARIADLCLVGSQSPPA